MTDQQHRATPQQWRDVRACADDIVTYSTILELHDRIEALESTAQPNYPAKPDSSLLSRVAAVIDNGIACDREPERIARDVIRAEISFSCLLELRDRIKALESTAQPNYSAKPDSSLLSRVAAVIDNGIACDREPERIARDVIRAVAAWLGEQKGYDSAWAIRLELEAER